MLPIILGGLAVGSLGGWALYETVFKKPSTMQGMKFGATAVVAKVGGPVTTAQSTMDPSHPTAVASRGNAGMMVISGNNGSSLSVASIKDVQSALNTLGYQPQLTVDGKIGPMTTNNVKQYQTKAGMTANGVVDQPLLDSLRIGLSTVGSVNSNIGKTAATATAAPTGVNTAQEVQHALNVLGAKPALAEDGKLGPISIAAIRVFQQTHGLSVDGIAGPQTKTAIALALQAVNNSPAVPFENPATKEEGEANLASLYQ